MKAIVYTEYGPPDVLQLKEVAKPTPADDEVLIKVRAVSVNRSDWEGLIGKPLYARIGGLRKPGRQILGSDIAGQVEAVGSKVTQLKAGDAVFGLMWGYAAAKSSAIRSTRRKLPPHKAAISTWL